MKYLFIFMMVLSLGVGCEKICVHCLKPEYLCEKVVSGKYTVCKEWLHPPIKITQQQHADIIKALEIGMSYKTIRFFLSEEHNGMKMEEWYKKHNDDFEFIQKVLKELKGGDS